jgi:hypothetical protein
MMKQIHIRLFICKLIDISTTLLQRLYLFKMKILRVLTKRLNKIYNHVLIIS